VLGTVQCQRTTLHSNSNTSGYYEINGVDDRNESNISKALAPEYLFDLLEGLELAVAALLMWGVDFIERRGNLDGWSMSRRDDEVVETCTFANLKSSWCALVPTLYLGLEEGYFETGKWTVMGGYVCARYR
jgi:hypothetical protein